MRSTPGRQRGQALILIFRGALLLGSVAGGSGLLHGGKAVRELKEKLEAVIADPDRRRALDDVLDAMQRENERIVHARVAYQHDALAVLGRHDATQAELDALAARADTLASDTRSTLLDLRFRLRSGLSEAEWRTLFSPDGR